VRGVQSIRLSRPRRAPGRRLPAANYRVDNTKGAARITPEYAHYFPPTRLVMNSVQVTYDVGLVVPGDGRRRRRQHHHRIPGHNKAAGDRVQLYTDGGTTPGGVDRPRRRVLTHVEPRTATRCRSPPPPPAPRSTSPPGYLAPVFIGTLPEVMRQALRLRPAGAPRQPGRPRRLGALGSPRRRECGRQVVKRQAVDNARAQGLVSTGALVKNIAVKREPNTPAHITEYHIGVRHGPEAKATQKIAVRGRDGTIRFEYVNDPFYWFMWEFGHYNVFLRRHVAARAFLRPAMASREGELLEVMRSYLAERLERTVMKALA
jgi:hypothetical protein